MAPWTIGRIEGETQKSLEAWTVFDVPSRGASGLWTRHFIGFVRESGKGQVSSPVMVFDPERRMGRTESGRIYQLAGYPGGNSDALYAGLGNRLLGAGGLSKWMPNDRIANRGRLRSEGKCTNDFKWEVHQKLRWPTMQA